MFVLGPLSAHDVALWKSNSRRQCSHPLNFCPRDERQRLVGSFWGVEPQHTKCLLIALVDELDLLDVQLGQGGFQPGMGERREQAVDRVQSDKGKHCSQRSCIPAPERKAEWKLHTILRVHQLFLLLF